MWYACWHFFTAATPDASTTISDAEREYIAAGSDFSPDEKVGDVPWKAIFTNKATWAIIIAHFCCTWGYAAFTRLVFRHLVDVLYLF